MTAIEALFCIILILSSAFFSSAEVALFSLSRFQLRYLRDNFSVPYRKIRKLLNDPGGLLLTILIANELVNISISTIIESVISRNWLEIQNTIPFSYFLTQSTHHTGWIPQMILGFVISTPIVLILCDLTPKVLGAHANKMVATLSAGPMLSFYSLTMPIRKFSKYFVFAVTGIKMVKGTSETSKNRVLKEEDFLMMVEEGRKEGMVNESEVELIRKVFKLDNTLVSQIYTPIQQAFTLPVTATMTEALAEVQRRKFFRIPIYNRNKSFVVGILYAKDLLSAKLNPKMIERTVDKIMRKPVVVDQSLPVNSLFTKLKRNKTHMAVVVDERHMAIGIVTLGDIIEEIFEEVLTPAPGGNK